MILEIRIPSPGESITEVAIGSWLVQDGDLVEKDQEIADVETDKATLPLIAPDSGQIRLKVRSGEKIGVGDVACTIDTGFSGGIPGKRTRNSNQTKIPGEKDIPPAAKRTDETAVSTISKEGLTTEPPDKQTRIKITPLARRKMEENNLSVDDILAGLRKITAADVELVTNGRTGDRDQPVPGAKAGRGERTMDRIPLSPLRRKLARRLVAVKNETAMLTTFNEVDMSKVLELRKKYQQAFQEKHGIKLGLMSFFARAASMALLQFPRVNSAIEEDQMVAPSYVDLGIAVQTEKGLLVPVIRNAETMSLVDLEKKIADMAQKARSNRISIEEMTGGTFTITNGGVYGSMLSTPILNPPQSAILGMHNIVERPVVIQNKIEIRPIMYLALSYDHRIIDGADSVRFLLGIKELIESPLKMAAGGDTEKDLLDF
jgi:2-oxoglutarate dehydrogenase E2 component (dihydrolipoamide succinyltransferase)